MAGPELPHHDATALFVPVTRQLDVSDRLTIPATTEITVALTDWLRIDRAEVDGVALTVERQGRLWRITNPAGPMESVTIHAAGSVPAMPPPDQRRRAAGAAADPEEGSFLPGYVSWLPDTGSEQVTYRLAVRVVGKQRAVATGRIVSEQETEGGFDAVFAADYPTEPPSLFIGPYAVAERNIDGIRLRTYFHEDIAQSSDHYISQSATYIRHFADVIGPYPFDDFHIVSAPLPVGLGFPNMTYIGRTIVPLPFMRGRSLAHEVLHNWWGNGVAIDYATGNWSEGLTTYHADYGLAVQDGADAAREMRLGWLRDYAALPDSDDTPVAAFVSKTHQASQVIGYNKVAHVFHMLRQEIGSPAFEKGIRLFWRDHKFSRAGWSDLQDAFESAAGRDLTWFFTQWIKQSGAPLIELAETRVINGADGYTLSITLRQTGKPYTLRIPIVIETRDGMAREFVSLSAPEETVTIKLPSAPEHISVDPDFDLFRRLLPGESPPIMRDITLAQAIDAVVLGNDEAFNTVALKLVNRLSGKTVPAAEGKPGRATIVVGKDDEIGRYAATYLAADVPTRVAAGSAAAWSFRSADGHPVLLIRGKDAAAVEALLRPLPHYGSRSFVTFEGRRAQDKGVWKSEESPLSRDLTAVD
ncbi:M1 family metallopeptidase [Hwanghaeella sp.]|uniref:M1 family metallopeptidase n=1 Tax=Hwanghaeella sp. TaxID=2605943 RepID=UPI003CCBAA91